jgi:hypothetical protein
VALHPATTASPTPSSPYLSNPFGDLTTPSPSPTETAASPAAAPTDYGLPLPTTPPNLIAPRLGTDQDGRPILATSEDVQGRAMMSMTTTWKWDGSRWKAIRSEPRVDAGSSLVYDPNLGKVVGLAGGITGSPYAMLGFDSNGWANLQMQWLPSHGQDVALLAFDRARRKLVALIPETATTSSTWTFDGMAGSKPPMAINPPPPFGAGMAYDPASSMVVLYGGHAGNGGPLDDTWTWDGTTWTQRHPAATPGGCEGPLAYDAAASQIILLCVREQQPMGRGNFSVSTWAWTGATWTQLHPSTMPPGGGRLTMTYDAVGRELVLFGSAHTWTYANGQWKQAA